MPTHLLLLGAGGFISMAMFRITDTLLPAIASDFGASIGSVATTVTAFTLGYGLFQLAHGPLGDRIGKLRVMAGALAVAGIATIACAATGAVAELAALRFASGMAAGAIVPMSIAHIGDTVPYDRRQATIGHYLSATVSGQIVAGSLAGVFAEFFDWRTSFVVVGAAGLVVAARQWQVASRMPRPVPSGATGARATHFDLLRRTDARIVWGAVFVEGCFALGAVPYCGAFLKHAFGLDYVTIGLVLGSFGAGGLAYSAAVRLLVKHLGERGMVLTGGVLVAASYVTVAAAPGWQVFIPALALIGFGFFCMHSTLQIRATELAPQARGTALAGFSFYLFLGQGAGVYVLGLVIDGPGYGAAFATAAAGVALLGVTLYAVLARRAGA